MKLTTSHTLMQLATLAIMIGVTVAKKGGNGGEADPASQDADAVGKEINLILSKYITIVMGLAIGVSLPLTFCGYRIISAVMFGAGAVFSGYGSYLLGDNLIPDDFSSKAAALIALSSVLGIIGGVLAWKLRKVGMFLAAAGGGVAGAFVLNGAVLSHLPLLTHSVPQLYLYVACLVLGILAGVLAFKLEKIILIVATAASGAAMLVLGIKFFLEKYVPTMPTTTWGDSRVWIYLGSLIAVFLVGVLVQLSNTNRKKRNAETRRKSLLAHEITSAGPVTGYETISVDLSTNEQKLNAPPSKMYVINTV